MNSNSFQAGYCMRDITKSVKVDCIESGLQIAGSQWAVRCPQSLIMCYRDVRSDLFVLIFSNLDDVQLQNAR